MRCALYFLRGKSGYRSSPMCRLLNRHWSDGYLSRIMQFPENPNQIGGNPARRGRESARWGKVFDRRPVQFGPPTEIPAGPALCRMSAFSRANDRVYTCTIVHTCPCPTLYCMKLALFSCVILFLNRAVKSNVKTHLFLSLFLLSLSCCLPT